MGYVTLEGDKWEEGWMADGCVNWFVRGYAMLGLGLDSDSIVPCSIGIVKRKVGISTTVLDTLKNY